MSEREQSHAEQGKEKYFFRASTEDFKKLPGNPITYWISDRLRHIFEANASMDQLVEIKQGLATADNDRFLRLWAEVDHSRIGFGCKDRSEATESGKKWFPHSKGGGFRKWFGNRDWIVNWENDGKELLDFRPRSVIRSPKLYFNESLSWSLISTAGAAFRFEPVGNIIGHKGPGIFGNHDTILHLLPILNACVSNKLLQILAPTIGFEVGQVSRIPVIRANGISLRPLNITENDWDSYEASWAFESLPLLCPDYCQPALRTTYQALRAYWRSATLEVQRLEQENNRTFIEAYGLQDELTPDVPLKEVTLTCNPHYRYGGDKTDDELEALLLADTMREFLSYAVGCMFGRYSLDKPGLVLANQGETLADYLRQISEPRFMPDADNVIPLLDDEWFPDDVTERFRQFLRVTFGDDRYAENLAFIEDALGKDVRRYFLKDFYTDHVKRYKKRPIYWLFASPKGTFSALIYLHRYRPDTVSVVLQYLRDFRKKLAARLEHLQQVQVSTSASQGEKTKAVKEADTIRKQQLELDDYERDTLYPLATKQEPLDLDDGVNVNYLKLGDALKAIPGLAGKES